MSELYNYDADRRDTALEVMAAMLGTRESRKREATSPELVARIEAEQQLLCREWQEIYEGNKEVIEKALTVYAREIRKQRGG